MADDILSLEEFLPYRLNRLADAISRDFAATYKERYGLTRPEWRLLATLGQYGVMTATAIAAHSAMHKTKVSRAVAELENRRWLSRQADENDGRVEHLMLTKAGQKAYRHMVPAAKAFERELLERIGTHRAARLRDDFTALEEALDIDNQAGAT